MESPEATGDENEKERIDRELGELLEELRVAIPGAEVLFAFLLGVAFTQTFADVNSLQRSVYFATLLLTAAATALLIAPTAHHRINFRGGDKKQLLFSATRMAISALVLLMLAVSGAVFLVGDVIYDSRAAAVAGGGMAMWFAWFWFVLPLLRRKATTFPNSKSSRPVGDAGLHRQGGDAG